MIKARWSIGITRVGQGFSSSLIGVYFALCDTDVALKKLKYRSGIHQKCFKKPGTNIAKC